MEELGFLEKVETPITATGDLMQYITSLDQVNDEIAAVEEQLATLKSVKRTLEEQTIPMFMDQHGVAEVKLANGRMVTVGEDLFCRLPEDVEKRMFALEWLREHGAGDKVKNEATIEQVSDETLEFLNSNGIGYRKVENVHPASLKAWFKELVGLKKGSVAQMSPDEIPQEFGVYIRRTTKIK